MEFCVVGRLSNIGKRTEKDRGNRKALMEKVNREPEELLRSLHNDEVITVNRQERSALYQLMEDKGIDPDDYRQLGNDVWLA